MAFFKDPNFDVTHRLTGFNRYRQLLYFYTLRWMKVNLLTVLGSVPLAAAIILSLATSSIVVLIPSTIVGGMIFGPFFAGMFDSIMRGLRDAPDEWQEHYKKSWKQNWKDSLFPGAIFGLLSGMFIFMIWGCGSLRSHLTGVRWHCSSSALCCFLSSPRCTGLRWYCLNKTSDGG